MSHSCSSPSIRVLVLYVLALSCLAGLGIAGRFPGGPVRTLPCDSSKGCATGPVFVHFTKNASCDPAAATYLTSFFNKGPNWPTGQCKVDQFGQSMTWSMAADGRSFSYSQWFHPACTGPQAFLEVRTLGLCVDTSARRGAPESYMILASVQDSIPPGKTTAQPAALPVVDTTSTKKCPAGATTCGYAWQTTYLDPKCTQPITSISSPLYTTDNQTIQLDSCYSLQDARGNLSNNVKYRCSNGMSSEIVYQGSGCDSSVLSSISYPTNNCIDTGYEKFRMYFC